MLQLLQQRRSIRRYQDKPIPPESLKKVLQGALLAPSSKSTREWEFIVIQDKETLLELSQCRAPKMTLLEGAPCAIVVMADPEKNDVWIEDCAIAAILLQLMAADLGLGSCWVQIRNRFSAQDGVTSESYLKEILNIPEKYVVLAVIALGYPAEEKKSIDLDKLLYDKIHAETFGKPYEIE